MSLHTLNGDFVYSDLSMVYYLDFVNVDYVNGIPRARGVRRDLRSTTMRLLESWLSDRAANGCTFTIECLCWLTAQASQS